MAAPEGTKWVKNAYPRIWPPQTSAPLVRVKQTRETRFWTLKRSKNKFQLRFCWKKCWNSLCYTQIAAKLDVTLSSVIFEKNHAQHSQTYEIWWIDPQKSRQDLFFDLSRVQKRVQHLSFTRTSGAEVCGGQMRFWFILSAQVHVFLRS